MNLTDLNKLQSEASSCESTARYLREDAARIARDRRDLGHRPLREVLDGLRQYSQARREAVERAEALLRDDLLRLAELDLEGQARRLTAEANAKRAALAAYFGEKAEGKPADEVPA